MQYRDIFKTHNGKLSDKWELYLSVYSKLFHDHGESINSILEIGVQNGGSLEIYAELLPRAQVIVGCDINPEVEQLRFLDPRIKVCIGDVVDESVYRSILREASCFDLIIDDGSHISSDIIATFLKYFPCLSNNGLYVIEDLHCSYWSSHGGGIYNPASSINFLKACVDVLHAEHWGCDFHLAGIFEWFERVYGIKVNENLVRDIHSIEFFNSICIIRKKSFSDNLLGMRVAAGQDAAVIRPSIGGQAQNRELTSPSNSVSFNPPIKIENLEGEIRLSRESLVGCELALSNYKAQFAEAREMILSNCEPAELEECHDIEFPELLFGFLEKKNEVIRRMEGELKVMEDALNDARRSIKDSVERDASDAAVACDYESRLDSLQKMIHAYQTSLSWRFTAPLRKLGYLFPVLRATFEDILVAIKYGGGVRNTIRTVRGVLAKEGLEGVRWRISNLRRISRSTEDNALTMSPFDAVASPARSHTLFNTNNPGALNVLASYSVASRQISIPVDGAYLDHGDISVLRIGLFLHAYYVEGVEDFARIVAKSNLRFSIFVSTDSQSKAVQVEHIFKEAGVRASVIICENFGRDIGPRFVSLRKEMADCDLGLLIHTKKSPHLRSGSVWRDYLWSSLIGTNDLISNVIDLFRVNPRLGMLAPEHWPELAANQPINWGYNFSAVQKIIREAGGNIALSTPLEFPSGSMFWFRPQALRYLLSREFTVDDFGPENGQVDGTFAHAIERSFFYVCELSGYYWIKYDLARGVPVGETPLLDSLSARLLGNDEFTPAIWSKYPETWIPPTCPDFSRDIRLNLMVPTLRKSEVFGGINTALNLSYALAHALSRKYAVSLRVIVTNDEYHDSEYFVSCRGALNSDVGLEVFSLADWRDDRQLGLRFCDIFLASAWWNARQMTSFKKRVASYFGVGVPYVYLIQDYEPGFYSWSSKSMLSHATYFGSSDEIRVVNDSYLAEYMSDIGVRCDVVIPFGLNDSLAGCFESRGEGVSRERIIIFYGRPGVERNLFELICDGLTTWAVSNPHDFAEWRIISIGQAYSLELLPNILRDKVEVLGKLSISAYADILMRASIGISLMQSPHPSYPPQEMACAGVTVLTNEWATKHWVERPGRYVPLSFLDERVLADALGRAVRQGVPAPFDCVKAAFRRQSSVNEDAANIISSRVMDWLYEFY